MSGHTPGPWKDDSMKFSAGWRCMVNIPGDRSIDIADPRNRKTDDEDKANAALIASAPDLLAERDSLKLQVDECVKAAKAAKRLLLDYGFHLQGTVMRELDKITILKMDPCIQEDIEKQKCEHDWGAAIHANMHNEIIKKCLKCGETEKRVVSGQIGPEMTTCGPCGTLHERIMVCPKCFEKKSSQ